MLFSACLEIQNFVDEPYLTMFQEVLCQNTWDKKSGKLFFYECNIEEQSNSQQIDNVVKKIVLVGTGVKSNIDLFVGTEIGITINSDYLQDTKRSSIYCLFFSRLSNGMF